MGTDNFAGLDSDAYDGVSRIESRKSAGKWQKWIDENRKRFSNLHVIELPPVEADGMTGIVDETAMQLMRRIVESPKNYTQDYANAGLTGMPKSAEEWNRLIRNIKKNS